MSETRPPITAGPMVRAFKFLKSTSASCGGAGEGVGVVDEDTATVGDAAVVGRRPGCGSSCAGKTDTDQIEISKAYEIPNRVVIGRRL
jgi:hypothetical protein